MCLEIHPIHGGHIPSASPGTVIFLFVPKALTFLTGHADGSDYFPILA